MKETVLTAGLLTTPDKFPHAADRHQAQVRANPRWCWEEDSRDSPMKWFWPKASISSKRTRPPGAWRRVTLLPSMREHC